MKNRTKYILAIVTVIVVAAVAIPLYVKSQHTTFRSEVTDHMTMLDKIELLQIRKITRISSAEAEEVQFRDQKGIQNVLKLFKDVELKKVQEANPFNDLPHYYEIRIVINKEGRFTEHFGVWVYSENTISTYNGAATRDAFGDFEITNNEFNFNELERIFNKLKEEAA
ncbi:hypothetical protein [Paenibacillus sp. MER 99-2]|uniref:hypothetical protein n=1 Tax=Paenibacillus sp. MER 99-2 TaxID=2939572 RepID=UPI0020424BDA|nr:hypothetical protein [Paenibacillus sp. MER 99-2]MCM3176205.1 hypothetical protein [Paenibacillus sp. MER 99-2]